MPTLVHLPTGKAVTVRAAADLFLGSLGNPNTVRNYGIAVGKTTERLGEGRPRPWGTAVQRLTLSQ